MNSKDEARFWNKVNKTDTCWLWTGKPKKNGYGRFGVQRILQQAHRLSWDLHNGPIPEGRAVLQTCGDRLCVRPDHLALSAGLKVPSASVTTRDRFFQYVVEGEEPAHLPGIGKCREWTGSKAGNGYGVFEFAGKTTRTHRYAWELYTGEAIPDSLHVLHRCDNRACVRPEHLFLGTNAENVADKVSKGRQAKGETIGKSKLTENDVVTIRALHANGVTLRELAERFGIHEVNVSAIVLRNSWAHVEAQDLTLTPDAIAAALMA